MPCAAIGASLRRPTKPGEGAPAMTVRLPQTRRAVLKTAALAGAGLPLAAILADPLIARAVAQGLEEVTITTPGGREVSAALAQPAATPAGAVLLIHEWWGLNDQIKAVAAELAKEGYVALAVDLMGGEVATTPEEAQALISAVQPDQATETLTAWIGWLRGQDFTTDKVATLGWCFGGGWSLNASLAAPVDATVIYYGRVPGDPAALENLQSPVLGHFGTQDQSIDQAMVQGFEQALTQAGKEHEIHDYDANHAFANPTGNNYDSEDARLAWQRTLAFLEQHIG
ncbi:MAG TPA: dienelactone hydrolase family protein [Alphaproteobacteria bacterium]|nr:dienelactone hydrolase family protein [Alphaproteobacteria bacterium]